MIVGVMVGVMKEVEVGMVAGKGEEVIVGMMKVEKTLGVQGQQQL